MSHDAKFGKALIKPLPIRQNDYLYLKVRNVLDNSTNDEDLLLNKVPLSLWDAEANLYETILNNRLIENNIFPNLSNRVSLLKFFYVMNHTADQIISEILAEENKRRG